MAPVDGLGEGILWHQKVSGSVKTVARKSERQPISAPVAARRSVPTQRCQPAPPPTTPQTGQIDTPNAPGVPPPPEAQQKSSWLSSVVIFLVILIVLVILLRSGGGGESGSANSEGPGAGRTFTNDDYAELATDPRSFRGASVDVTGRLIRNPEVSGDTTSFQMWADPENFEWNTIVHTDSAPDDLTNGDTVRVQGTVMGGREGENAMGGTVRAVEVDAESVEMVEESRRP